MVFIIGQRDICLTVSLEINLGSYSSRGKISLQRMSWIIDYAEINNTAIMLTFTQTVIYRASVCEPKVDQNAGK